MPQPGACTVTTMFDYASLTPAEAAALRQQAVRLRGLVATSTSNMIQIGAELMSIKRRLEHGQFTDWIEREIRISARTAQRFIAVSKLAEGKTDTVSLLPPSTVRMLAVKSTPPEIVEQVIARAESGDILSESAVKEMISDDRETKRNAKREAEAAARRARSKRVRAKAAAEREVWRAEQEQKRLEDQAKAQSIIDRFSPEDARFLADTLTCDVFDEFYLLVREGGAA